MPLPQSSHFGGDLLPLGRRTVCLKLGGSFTRSEHHVHHLRKDCDPARQNRWHTDGTPSGVLLFETSCMDNL